jgi:hypothetical protein
MSVAVAAAAATPSPSVIEQTAVATMVARRSTATTAETDETDESSVLDMQEGSDRVLQLLENAAVAASYGDSVMNLCQKSENLFIKNGGGDSDVITSNNRRVLAGNSGDVLYNSGGVTVKSSLELMEEGDDDLPLVISQRQQEQQLQQQLKQQQQLGTVLATDGGDPEPRFEPPSGDHQLMHMPDTIFILCSDEKDDSDAFQNAMR